MNSLIETLKTKAAFIANERAVLAYELTLIDKQIKVLAELGKPQWEEFDDSWELDETILKNQKNSDLENNLQQNLPNRLVSPLNGLIFNLLNFNSTLIKFNLTSLKVKE